MDQLRTDIWDHLFRSGPQTVEQLVASLNSEAVVIEQVVQHEWFEVLDSKVRIAGRQPRPTPDMLA